MLRRLTPSPSTVPAAAGVVPRMRRPRDVARPMPPASPVQPGPDVLPRGRGTALAERIDRHLTRMRGTAPVLRPGAVDDDLARRDPETASFAAIPAGVTTGVPAPGGARVATAQDRPRTARLPVLPAHG